MSGMTKNPVFWLGQSFGHVSSDGLEDRYLGKIGRLVCSRNQGIWLAYLHGATGAAGPFPASVEPNDGARAALEAARVALRSRVVSDQTLLAELDEEAG